MTSTDRTTTDHEPDGTTEHDLPEEIPTLDPAGDDFDDEPDDEPADLDEGPVAVGAVTPSPRRRAVSALVATVAFELLYLLGITIIAFAISGAAAVGPTLQSVFVSPFAWVPAAVFLVCALVVALPLRGARRAPALTGLVVAAVVYLATTFFVLLTAAGWTAMGVFTQELGVYPFFLAAIVAREVMVWTRFGSSRTRKSRVLAEPVVSAPA